MNTTPHPIDALALAAKIERLIPGDPLAAELRRLHIVEQEFQQWINKTEWVQKSAQSHELGMHRADVLKQRIDCLVDENNELQRHRATCIAGCCDRCRHRQSNRIRLDGPPGSGKETA